MVHHVRRVQQEHLGDQAYLEVREVRLVLGVLLAHRVLEVQAYPWVHQDQVGLVVVEVVVGVLVVVVVEAVVEEGSSIQRYMLVRRSLSSQEDKDWDFSWTLLYGLSLRSQ